MAWHGHVSEANASAAVDSQSTGSCDETAFATEMLCNEMLGSLTRSRSREGSITPKQQLSPQYMLEESSLVESKVRNRETLKRRLENRRSVTELVDQGLYPPLNTPPAYAEQKRHLEIAQRRDRLRHNLETRPDRRNLIQQHILEDSTASPALHARQRELKKALEHRPDRDFLVQQHILEDTNKNVDPSLQSIQKSLKRAKICDALDDALYHRRGPLELVEEGIIEEEGSIRQALKDHVLQYPKTCESENIADKNSSHFKFDFSLSNDGESDRSSLVTMRSAEHRRKERGSCSDAFGLLSPLSDTDSVSTLQSPHSVESQQSLQSPAPERFLAIPNQATANESESAGNLSVHKGNGQPTLVSVVSDSTAPETTLFTFKGGNRTQHMFTDMTPALMSSSTSKSSVKGKKSSRARALPKPKTFKFHNYTGPPGSDRPVSGTRRNIVEQDDTPYKILLQQQHLLINWRLERMSLEKKQAIAASELVSSDTILASPPPAPPPPTPALDIISRVQKVPVLSKNAYTDMKVPELRSELKRRALPSAGNKTVLIQRLLSDDTRKVHSKVGPAAPESVGDTPQLGRQQTGHATGGQPLCVIPVCLPQGGQTLVLVSPQQQAGNILLSSENSAPMQTDSRPASVLPADENSSTGFEGNAQQRMLSEAIDRLREELEVVKKLTQQQQQPVNAPQPSLPAFSVQSTVVPDFQHGTELHTVRSYPLLKQDVVVPPMRRLTTQSNATDPATESKAVFLVPNKGALLQHVSIAPSVTVNTLTATSQMPRFEISSEAKHEYPNPCALSGKAARTYKPVRASSVPPSPEPRPCVMRRSPSGQVLLDPPGVSPGFGRDASTVLKHDANENVSNALPGEVTHSSEHSIKHEDVTEILELLVSHGSLSEAALNSPALLGDTADAMQIQKLASGLMNSEKSPMDTQQPRFTIQPPAQSNLDQLVLSERLPASIPLSPQPMELDSFPEIAMESIGGLPDFLNIDDIRTPTGLGSSSPALPFAVKPSSDYSGMLSTGHGICLDSSSDGLDHRLQTDTKKLKNLMGSVAASSCSGDPLLTPSTRDMLNCAITDDDPFFDPLSPS